MTIYVDSAGSDTAPYDSWATAATSIYTAIAYTSADGQEIWVEKGFTEAINEVALNFLYSGRILCVDKTDDSIAISTGSLTSTGQIYINPYNINLSIYVFGLNFVSSTTNTSKHIYVGNKEGTQIILENCGIEHNSGSNAFIVLGAYGVDRNPSFVKLISPRIKFNNAAQALRIPSVCEIEDLQTVTGSTSTDVLINNSNTSGLNRYANASVKITNSDLSQINDYVVGDCYKPGIIATFIDCSLPAIPLLAPQTVKNKSSAQVYIFNSSSSDQHYHIGYADVFGEIICDTGIYKTDNPGSLSWKITTTSDCTIYAPFITPFLDAWHTETSAITPSIEIMRNDSASALYDNEVYAKFSYQGTSGSPLGISVSNRMELLGTPAAIPDGAGLASWTGEGGTAWSGKLVSPSITPLNPGTVRAQIAVSKASQTIYANPFVDI